MYKIILLNCVLYFANVVGWLTATVDTPLLLLQFHCKIFLQFFFPAFITIQCLRTWFAFIEPSLNHNFLYVHITAASRKHNFFHFFSYNLEMLFNDHRWNLDAYNVSQNQADHNSNGDDVIVLRFPDAIKLLSKLFAKV